QTASPALSNGQQWVPHCSSVPQSACAAEGTASEAVATRSPKTAERPWRRRETTGARDGYRLRVTETTPVLVIVRLRARDPPRRTRARTSPSHGVRLREPT